MCVRTHLDILVFRLILYVRAHALSTQEEDMTQLITRDALVEELSSGKVVLIDALGAAYYEQQHLPGALNLVEEEVAERAAELVPDKDAAIVVYCSNTACNNSQAVANRLAALGYTNIRKYREGIQDWVEAGLPTESGARAA
jgi:rhodanese-related sulfurtransferase